MPHLNSQGTNPFQRPFRSITPHKTDSHFGLSYPPRPVLFPFTHRDPCRVCPFPVPHPASPNPGLSVLIIKWRYVQLVNIYWLDLMVAISVVVGVFCGDGGFETIIQIEKSFTNLFCQLRRAREEKRADGVFNPETTTDGVWFQF